MPLTQEQKNCIRQIISNELKRKIQEFSEAEDMNKPFYFELFSKKLVLTHALLQSVFTWFGKKWEDFAEIIAKDNFEIVKKEEKIKGRITPEERAKIDNILDELDKGAREPDIEKEKREILGIYNKQQEHEDVEQQVDMIINTADGNEYYIESKSVKPNKNEIKAAKRDLLKIIAMRHKEQDINKIHVFLVLPFNPYFSGNYRRWTVTKFFKLNKDLLVGESFWDFIGGEGTYDDLLNVFREIGNEIMPLFQATINRLSED